MWNRLFLVRDTPRQRRIAEGAIERLRREGTVARVVRCGQTRTCEATLAIEIQVSDTVKVTEEV